MGYMNIAALKHDQVTPTAHLDVPRDLYAQSCRSPFHEYPLAPLSPEIITDVLGDTADKRFFRASMMGENGLYTGNSWHTNASGTLILTSDYFINLHGYRVFGGFPVKDEAREQEVLTLTGDTLVAKMAEDYRKDLKKARASLKNNGRGDLVTTRKLMDHDPRASDALPEAVVADSDLTGFLWVNYDCLHEDREPRGGHLSSEQWQALIREGRGAAPGFGRWHENDVANYRSLGGFTTLGQQDVMVVQYDHLTVWHSVCLTRARRTPPEALYPDHLRHNDSLSTVLSGNYPLMREFFASQGVRVQL